MPKLIVIYDPIDRIQGPNTDWARDMGIKDASLSLPEGLENKDIYSLARKLAELLLEQL